jgi:diguanylate cyclase (GGDEF)-like protein
MPWNDFWSLATPSPAVIVIVAIASYVIGRSRRLSWATADSNRLELKRAMTVIAELEVITRRVRGELSKHQASLMRFRDKMTEMQRKENAESLAAMLGEAEYVLKPTLELCQEIAAAYDALRYQTSSLMSLTENRTDALTGLGNRRSMEEALQAQFALSGRYKTYFSVALFDLDRFKAINDEHGHLAGDELLRRFGEVLGENTRETDIACRFGGEEFVVVMPETDLAGALRFAERVRKAAEQRLETTVSAGVAMALDGDTPKSLIGRADEALYTAKHQGRNCVFQHTGLGCERYNPSLDKISQFPAARPNTQGPAMAISE